MGKIYKLTDKNGNVLYPMTVGDAIAVDGATLTKKITTEATLTARGMMSAADKVKLEGIATGATANKGTVTSVKIKAGKGIAVDNQNPITESGERTISLATNGVTKGTYKNVAVDEYGRVTSGSNPTTLEGYGIRDAKIEKGTITLGTETITPLTHHQDISGKQDKITASGILKGNGNGSVSAAVAGTDYLTPSDLNSMVKVVSPAVTSTAYDDSLIESIIRGA